jgi:hypothetical protein
MRFHATKRLNLALVPGVRGLRKQQRAKLDVTSLQFFDQNRTLIGGAPLKAYR